jgi:Tol biopolymer transport system component
VKSKAKTSFQQTLTCAGFETSQFGVEWLRFEADAPFPELVKTVPHVAFVVDDLDAAIDGSDVLIQPNSPTFSRLGGHHADEHITDAAQDWLASSIYVLPSVGSPNPVKVTKKTPGFWHGWSPDGKTLAFVGRRGGEWDIYTIPASGGEEQRLTTGCGLEDGPDYSPDGEFIYYNSYCSGKMEIWRMRSDGSRAEQLTRDDHSNWFPHPSPDGRWVVFLAYLEGQGEDHPFGKQVKLRLMDLRDFSVRDLTPPFFGGQGTINVPSWSPDSQNVAFVAYERR